MNSRAQPGGPARSLRALNQNLLPVLRELLRTQNLSHAATSLHLSQPSVSAALKRLRESLGDPLLVRVGRSMELTPRARQLLPMVERACEAMSRVWDLTAFDPAQSRRRFVIATVDHGALLLAPPLLARLDREARGVGLQFIQFSTLQAQRHRMGDIDLLLVSREAIDALGQPDLHVVSLFDEQLVAVVGPDHALARKPTHGGFSIEAHAHVLYYPGIGLLDGFYGDMDRTTDGDDIANGPRRALRVEQFSVLPLLAAMTGRVAVIPSSMVDRMRPFVELHVVEQAPRLAALEVCLAWSPIHDADPAHRWLRRAIQDLFRDAGEPTERTPRLDAA